MANKVSYPTIQNLIVHEGDTAEQIIGGNLGKLKGLNEKAIVQFRITGVPGTGSPQNYTIVLTSSGAFFQKQSTGKSSLSVIVAHDTFVSIAKGSYSPFQAFLDGKLHPLGDVALGRRIIEKLSPDIKVTGVPIVCPTITNESWTYNGDGVGTITLVGEGFAPLGKVEISFDLGGEFFPPQLVTANNAGFWSTSQNEVPCGAIPGSSFGIIITAADLTTNSSVTQGYPTPCQ